MSDPTPLAEGSSVLREEIARLLTWLHTKAEDYDRKARWRIEAASTERTCSDADAESARLMAERMSGRKIPAKTRAQRLADADMHCRIAAKDRTERELYMLTAALLSRLQALEDGLRKLMKESAAVEALAAEELRERIGYTNLRVWQTRIEEADALLASTGPRREEAPASPGEGSPR